MEIRFEVGDLTNVEVSAIVNPANSECEMGGGVAGAIKKKGGKRIEAEAMAYAPVAIGKAVVTTAGGRLKCDYVIHAPTMEMPVQRTTTGNIAKAVRAALEVARDEGLTSVAFPGMGTGVGRVPVADAARTMIETVRAFFAESSFPEEIVLVDRSEEMVAAWEAAWQEQPAEEAAEDVDDETPA